MSYAVKSRARILGAERGFRNLFFAAKRGFCAGS